MIDVENIVYDTAANAIHAKYPGAFVSGEYVESPANFPAVTIVESNNSVYRKMSAEEKENAAQVTYECNVYSNKTTGRKAEAKAVAAVLDEAFNAMGFTRQIKQVLPNLQDAGIYRIFLRYEGIVDKEHWVFQS